MIHLYPGMGATSDMYSGPWRNLPDAIFHDWPAFDGQCSVRQLSEQLIYDHGIREADILIGSSLGGIIACEISNILGNTRLIIVGSAIHKSEINHLLSLLHPMIGITPIELLKLSAGKIPEDLTQMFMKSDSGFIRSMCKAIFNWEGLMKPSAAFRIHGTKDLVIPCPDSVDIRIPAGHLIAMTHAQECVNACKMHLHSLEPS